MTPFNSFVPMFLMPIAFPGIALEPTQKSSRIEVAEATEPLDIAVGEITRPVHELDESCGEFWTAYVSGSTSSYDQTSPNAIPSGCNTVIICLTGNNTSGSAAIAIYEVASGGSQTAKWTRYITYDWCGCYPGQPTGCSGNISFSVANGSKIRIVVTSNSLELNFQVDTASV